MFPPLRCHLLIGPPGSGKTTFAKRLAPLLTGPGGQPGLVLSTDAIREQLFGDAAVQGPWDEIRAVLLKRLNEAVEQGVPVVIDATHARRPWRLLYTQFLALPAPVEWIGWWLTTPLDTCKQWALLRERPVPVAVIEEFRSSIGHKHFGPSRAEGFALVEKINPAAESIEPAAITARLHGFDKRIRSALNRDKAKTPFLHRYSQLLDLERLLFLLRLLSTHNGLDSSDPATANALRQIINPAPEGDLAQRAAAYLGVWRDVHEGFSECYADAGAIRADLAWLEANGFFRLDWQSQAPILPGDPPEKQSSTVNGGYPAMADARIFRRVFTLLRHIIQEPFDAPSPSLQGAKGHPKAEHDLYTHLIDRLSEIDGAYTQDQRAVMRKDLEELLNPYGFRTSPQGQGRPDSLRHGYSLGTALLSADQLLQVHALLKASLERLSDASQKPLLDALEERLRWAGLLGPQLSQRRFGSRAMANRSFTAEKSGTLASREQSQRLEQAIRDRRRLRLRHTLDPEPTREQRLRGDDGTFVVWPLQILFHNISWYLAFENHAVGSEHGLIRTLRLDRLELIGEDGNARRSTEADHDFALRRLERLLHVCGGLYFGHEIKAQLDLIPPAEQANAADTPTTELPGAEWFDRLRFSCTEATFRLIREEPHRYPPEHTRYSRPIQELSNDAATERNNKRDTKREILRPNAASDSHPYPVEIRLPRWTIEADWDLRAWLFRYGAGIRIEKPDALRRDHRQMAREVEEMYARADIQS